MGAEASDVVRPVVVGFAFIEQAIDDLVDEGIDECAAAHREDAAHVLPSAGQPREQSSASHGSRAHPTGLSYSLYLHLFEQRVPRHHLHCQRCCKHNLQYTTPNTSQSRVFISSKYTVTLLNLTLVKYLLLLYIRLLIATILSYFEYYFF